MPTSARGFEIGVVGLCAETYRSETVRSRGDVGIAPYAYSLLHR